MSLPGTRNELTHAWADALSATAYVPRSEDQITHLLGGLLDRLIETLTQAAFSPHAGVEIGAQLVADGFAGGQSLGVTVELLTQALPANEELSTVAGLPGKVASLLGALTSGYVAALRRQTLDQQEDIKRALTRAIRDSEARFREAFISTPVGLGISELTGELTKTNSALSDILGYTAAELAGRDVHDLFHPEDAGELAVAYQDLVEGHRPRFRARVKLLAATGDPIWGSIGVSVLRNRQGKPTHHVTMIEDISDQHHLEQRLREQALHDVLTGLPNQEYFWIHLNTVLERAHPEATVTLCKIDLDGFSVINDGHGHDGGNLVLRSVANRLQELVSGQDAMVARFGADEFVIVIEDSRDPVSLVSLAKNINAELSEPVYFGDHGLAVSTGVGLVRRPARGTAAAELVRVTDTALHRAKRIGRGQWGIDDPVADARERTRYTLATAMPGAWENGAVTLRYQPVVRLNPADDADRILAVQALLHWEHPEHGVLAPEECLALAEQTGLILSIGPWLLQQACAALRDWRDQLAGASPLIRVDLTTCLAQDPDLMAVLRDTLDSSRLRPEDLQLGIPIGPLVAGSPECEDNLHTLAGAGFRTVLTHYAQAVGNMITLQSHPVQAVDITDSLVSVAARRPDSVVRKALIALLPLIHDTGATVFVSDIDTAEQADWWRSIGADFARGTAFAPACKQDEILTLLKSGVVSA